jgi:hypothetical protein
MISEIYFQKENYHKYDGQKHFHLTLMVVWKLVKEKDRRDGLYG